MHCPWQTLVRSNGCNQHTGWNTVNPTTYIQNTQPWISIWTNSAQPAAVIKTGPSGFASNLPPIYPNLARRRGIQGTVVIIAGISPSGLVSSTKIKTSSGSGTLDNAAIRAIRDWRFTPATNNGRPITSEVEIPLTFKLSSGLPN